MFLQPINLKFTNHWKIGDWRWTSNLIFPSEKIEFFPQNWNAHNRKWTKKAILITGWMKSRNLYDCDEIQCLRNLEAANSVSKGTRNLDELTRVVPLFVMLVRLCKECERDLREREREREILYVNKSLTSNSWAHQALLLVQT